MELAIPSRRAAIVATISAVAVAVPCIALLVRRLSARPRKRYRGRVKRLLRYPVKGLDFMEQPLRRVALEPKLCLPNDRRWALKTGQADAGYGDFDPQNPQWVHKLRFAASCSEGPALGSFRAEWRDDDCALALFAKGSDRQSPPLLPPTSLLRADTLQIVQDFFQKHLRDPGLMIVTASDGNAHQFANTKQVSCMEGYQTLHIVNLATVQAFSKAANVEIDWRRFRPNILLDCGDELPPWAEFEWVGRRICAGDAWLRVTKRTVRCDATKTNPETAVDDIDVPKLLHEHFPEHGPYLGVYAVVERGGEIGEGDSVEGPF